jgi:hypothetical protein
MSTNNLECFDNNSNDADIENSSDENNNEYELLLNIFINQAEQIINNMFCYDDTSKILATTSGIDVVVHGSEKRPWLFCEYEFNPVLSINIGSFNKGQKFSYIEVYFEIKENHNKLYIDATSKIHIEFYNFKGRHGDYSNNNIINIGNARI